MGKDGVYYCKVEVMDIDVVIKIMVVLWIGYLYLFIKLVVIG